MNWTVVRTIKCLENVRNCIGTDYRGGMIDTKSCECSSPMENVTLVTPPNIGELDKNK